MLAGALDPLAALLLGAVLGGVLAEPLALEPPDAESFFVASADEDELDDGLLGVVPEAALEESFFDMSTDAEPEVEPDGLLGVVEPADEDDEPGVVVRETALSPSLSQPVRTPAPSARDTATAKAESLICGPPWVGVRLMEQGLGLSL